MVDGGLDKGRTMVDLGIFSLEKTWIDGQYGKSER